MGREGLSTSRPVYKDFGILTFFIEGDPTTQVGCENSGVPARWAWGAKIKSWNFDILHHSDHPQNSISKSCVIFLSKAPVMPYALGKMLENQNEFKFEKTNFVNWAFCSKYS